MTPEQARALFYEHREPGDLAHYGEKAAVAAILAATDQSGEVGRLRVALSLALPWLSAPLDDRDQSASGAAYRAVAAALATNPATAQTGEVEPIDKDEALEAVADCYNGSDVYGRTEAWAEGKTLSILFKGTGQIAKLRFVKLADKPSSADLRGEPA